MSPIPIIQKGAEVEMLKIAARCWCAIISATPDIPEKTALYTNAFFIVVYLFSTKLTYKDYLVLIFCAIFVYWILAMNIDEIKLRPVVKEDLLEMQKLFVETIRAVCKKDYDSSQIDVWTSSISNEEKWLKKMEQQYFIIAYIDDLIVGYASLENYDYFDFLYVHKDFQRKGIAQMLLHQIEKKAIENGGKIITSDVSITAKPFFEKNAYTIQKTNINTINGTEIINYHMTKHL